MTRSGFDNRPQFDHLILVVAEPEPVRRTLASDWGLRVHPDGHVFENGLANSVVPLEPPEYLEILYIHDRDAFARQPEDDVQRLVLAGGGLLGWGLRTWDLAAVARELRVESDMDLTRADGTAVPWRVVERRGSPLGFPFYIEYDASPDERIARWSQRLADVGHRARPGGTQWVEVSGDKPELDAWLRPARHLNVHVVAGEPRLRAAVPIGDRLLTLSSDIPGGIVPSS